MSDRMDNIKFIAYLRGKKNVFIIAAALVIGVCLMLFGTDGGGKDTKVSAAEGLAVDTDAIEAKVKDLCEHITGVSDVKVMITLDTYGEQIYAHNVRETKNGDNSEKRLEYVNASGGLAAVGEVMPKVRGIAVVCEGGDDAAIRLKLTELLCALFSVPSSSISVVGGK